MFAVYNCDELIKQRNIQPTKSLRLFQSLNITAFVSKYLSNILTQTRNLKNTHNVLIFFN